MVLALSYCKCTCDTTHDTLNWIPLSYPCWTEVYRLIEEHNTNQNILIQSTIDLLMILPSRDQFCVREYFWIKWLHQADSSPKPRGIIIFLSPNALHNNKLTGSRRLKKNSYYTWIQFKHLLPWYSSLRIFLGIPNDRLYVPQPYGLTHFIFLISGSSSWYEIGPSTLPPDTKKVPERYISTKSEFYFSNLWRPADEESWTPHLYPSRASDNSERRSC